MQSPQLTYILYISALLLMKVCVCFYFLESAAAAAHLVKYSFICLSCFSQHSRICMLTFFCCSLSLECAGLQDLKITKQHEAAAYKLWMRSRSANTARHDMRGDFVLDSPLVVSYLCSIFLLPCLLCAHFKITIAGYQNCLPWIRSVIIWLE